MSENNERRACSCPIEPDQCPIHHTRYHRALLAERQVAAQAFYAMVAAYREGRLSDELVDNLEAAAQDLDLAVELMRFATVTGDSPR